MKNNSSQDKDKPISSKQNWQTICIIFAIIVLFFSIIFAIYSMLTMLLPGFISMIIIIGMHFYLLKVLIRSMLFPGSIKLMQRSSEYNFMINRAKIMHSKMLILNVVIESIESQNTFALMDYSSSDLLSIHDRITTMNNSYKKLSEKKIISKYQSIFYEIIKNVQDQCQKTIISSEGSTFTVWEMLCNPEYLNNIKNNGK